MVWGRNLQPENIEYHFAIFEFNGSGSLENYMPTAHILDLLFEPEYAAKGKLKNAITPVTYINRMILKRRIKKELKVSISGERNMSFMESLFPNLFKKYVSDKKNGIKKTGIGMGRGQR